MAFSMEALERDCARAVRRHEKARIRAWLKLYQTDEEGYRRHLARLTMLDEWAPFSEHMHTVRLVLARCKLQAARNSFAYCFPTHMAAHEHLRVLRYIRRFSVVGGGWEALEAAE